MKICNMNIQNYALNIENINKIENQEDRQQIHRYYMDMMCSFQDGRLDIGQSLFNTLYLHHFLIDVRDEKINKILLG